MATKTEEFDPYRKWLGIPKKDQPPHHYRLLGIQLFEHDPDVIEAAANARMAHLRTYNTSKRAKLSQQLLNEISAARICLLDPEKKNEYDTELRAELIKKKRAREQRKAQEAESAEADGVPVAEAVESDVPIVTPVETDVDHAAPIVGSPRSSASKSLRQRQRKSPATMLAVIGSILAVVVIVGVVIAVSMNRGKGDVASSNGGAEKPGIEKPNDKASGDGSIKPDKPKDTSKRPANSGLPVNPAFIDPNKPPDVSFDPSKKTGRRHVADATSEAVDLLTIIEPSKDALNGLWMNEEVVGLAGKSIETLALLQVPCKLPTHYALHVNVARLSGDGPLCIGIVAANNRVNLMIDEPSGESTATGLSLIDGKTAGENGTARNGTLLAIDVDNELIVAVLEDRILVGHQGEAIIDWNGSFDQLSSDDRMKPAAIDQLSLAIDGAEFRISKLTVEPIADPAEFKLQPAKPRPVVEKREPVPEKATVAKARAELELIFKAELEAEKFPSKQREMIDDWVQQALKSEDSAAQRYAVLLAAAELAAGLGEAELALGVADQRAASFEVDVLDDKFALVRKAAESAADSVKKKEVGNAARAIADAAVKVKRFDDALRLLSEVEPLVKDADPVLGKRIGEQIDEIKSLQSDG